MEYFHFLTQKEKLSLFYKNPMPVSKKEEVDLLRYAVGALLYIPGTNEKIASIVTKSKIMGACSVCICLEDAVSDNMLESAIQNVKSQIKSIEQAVSEDSVLQESLPLLFIRVRHLSMLRELKDFFIRYASIITGVVLPKITKDSLRKHLEVIEEINQKTESKFYAMPILEAAELAQTQDRLTLLGEYKKQCDLYFPYILNIRLGTTDFCGLYGIRRGINTSIHQVGVANALIQDAVSIFAYQDRYTVSAPVFEYFPDALKAVWDSKEINGLLREMEENKSNGMLGKTAVHPSHLLPIQSLHCVNFDEYRDAISIVKEGNDAVMAGWQHNKMNEVKPHALWASKILKRSSVYGVYQKEITSIDFLKFCSKRGAIGGRRDI